MNPHEVADGWLLESDSQPSLVAALDEALAWVRPTLANHKAEVDDTSAFFALGHAAQVLAIECLRASARGAVAASGIPADTLVAAVDESCRHWVMA